MVDIYSNYTCLISPNIGKSSLSAARMTMASPKSAYTVDEKLLGFNTSGEGDILEFSL